MIILFGAAQNEFLPTKLPAFGPQYVLHKAVACVGRRAFIESIPCQTDH